VCQAGTTAITRSGGPEELEMPPRQLGTPRILIGFGAFLIVCGYCGYLPVLVWKTVTPPTVVVLRPSVAKTYIQCSDQARSTMMAPISADLM
jgi:hypothetical protein